MSEREREPLGKFAPDNINDHILHVIFELAAELWVVKRRLAEVEGAAVANGVPPSKIRHVWGITKVYETYVGGKKYEPEDPIFDTIRMLGTEYGATTGRPRQCNWINTSLLRKAANVNGVSHVVFNKADILRKLNMWKAYDLNGTLITFQDEELMKTWMQELLPNTEIYWSDSPDKL